MSDLEPFSPPKEETFDKIISIIRAVSSEIPGGNLLTELTFPFLRTPYQHRQDQWMEKIGKTLKELSGSGGFALKDPRSNETFLDIVLKTTQVALQNHHEMKSNPLIQIIRNAAQPDPDEVFLQTAMNFIDTSTRFVW